MKFYLITVDAICGSEYAYLVDADEYPLDVAESIANNRYAYVSPKKANGLIDYDNFTTTQAEFKDNMFVMTIELENGISPLLEFFTG